MHVQLRQRGRARIDFASDLAKWTGQLGPRSDAELADRGLTPERLHADRAERLRQVDEVMADSNTYQAWAQTFDYLADAHGRIATEAFEEIHAELQPVLNDLSTRTACTLKLDPTLVMPKYFDGVEFHRTAGGLGWASEPGPYSRRNNPQNLRGKKLRGYIYAAPPGSGGVAAR